MSGGPGNNQSSTWPLPKFLFSVDLGTELKNLPFQEVTGLETETQDIEYRHGDSQQFATIKMPGLAKAGNVTMKKGLFVNDTNFRALCNQLKLNTIKRLTVVVRLLDETGRGGMTWTLTNAWVTKIHGTDLKSDANEVAVETIEIAYEQLHVSNPETQVAEGLD